MGAGAPSLGPDSVPWARRWPFGPLSVRSDGLFQGLRKPLPFRDWEADWGRKKQKSKESKPRPKWPTPGTSLAVQWLRLCLPMQGGCRFDPWSGN